MADSPFEPQTNETSVRPGRGPRPGMPGWVKVFVIIAAVLIVVFIIGLFTGNLGPGGRHGPGRHMGNRGDSSPSSDQNPGGIGGPADADEAVRSIEVIALDSKAFEPARISVSEGETITFVLTNKGQEVHEFTLGDETMQEEHAEAMAHIPAGMAHDTPNSVTLQPGETKKLTWRFGKAGTLEYGCHVPGHYQAGMRGQITIS